MKWANQETSQITGPVFSLCYNGGCRSPYLSVLCELWGAVAYSVDPRTEGRGKSSRLDGLWNSLMAQQFYGQSHETIARWKPNIEGMLPSLKHEDYLTMVLSCNLKPICCLAEIEEYTSSHYVHNPDRALEQMERYYLQAINAWKPPLLAMQGQVQFMLAPPDYVARNMHTTMNGEYRTLVTS